MINILNTDHPRLFINNERIAEMKELLEKDIFFRNIFEGFIKKANRYVSEGVVEFKITGPRMLKNCQEIHSRVATLSLAYHFTGNKNYAFRAKDELMSAANYPHWNKDHFLDTAELITAFAIGYDWLFHVLAKPDLEIIKKAMISKGIEVGLEEHKTNIWWAGHKYNWNQVCNGGLIIGALAIADEEKQLCTDVFDATVKYLQGAFNSYGKDGGWEGGPDYWQYTTWYSTLLIEALQQVTGNDFALSQTPGFDRTGLFPIYNAGTNGKFFNFADADETYNSLPVLFWLGNKFHSNDCISENHRLLQQAVKSQLEIDPFNLVWYAPLKANTPKLPLNKVFNDFNTGYFRSKWDDTEATYIGFKGGNNQADHTHLDLGSFVLDMQGERWASDLGRDSYDLPNYWDFQEGGGRWKYFRLNTKSHNTLVLNNDNQWALAKAPITHFQTYDDFSAGIIDLSEAYRSQAKSVIRTIKLTSDSSVIVLDKIEWANAPKLAQWQILTDASILLLGRKAVLSKNEKKIVVSISKPANALFEIILAEQPAPEMKNQGFKLLVVRNAEEGYSTEFEISFEAVLKR